MTKLKQQATTTHKMQEVLDRLTKEKRILLPKSYDVETPLDLAVLQLMTKPKQNVFYFVRYNFQKRLVIDRLKTKIGNEVNAIVRDEVLLKNGSLFQVRVQNYAYISLLNQHHRKTLVIIDDCCFDMDLQTLEVPCVVFTRKSNL
jgi:hypothetical protein